MNTQENIADQKAASGAQIEAGPVRERKDGRTSLRLHGRALRAARVTWIAFALATWAWFITAIPLRYSQLANPSAALRQAIGQLGLSVDFYAAYAVGLEITLALATAIIGLIIFMRKSDEVIALYASILNIIFGACIYPISETIYSMVLGHPEYGLPFRLLNCLAWLGALCSFYIFPDGRFVPRWTGFTIVPFMVLMGIIWVFFPDSPFNVYNLPLAEGAVLWAALWVCSLAALIYRYVKVSGPIERQQTKWILLSSSTGAIVGFLAVLLRALDPSVALHVPTGSVLHLQDLVASPTNAEGLPYTLASSTLIYICLLFSPAAYAISITRYRLWDIDLLINRALVYIPLTGIVAGLYAASTVLLQKLFLAFTGQQSDAAIVLTTLIIASTFTPIKNAIQGIVDKRFKPAPDPKSRLDALGKRMHSIGEVIDPRRITQHLLDEAIDAYRATGGAIYLRKDGHLGVVHSSDNWHPADAKLRLQLGSEGEHLGTLELGPRRDGDDYTPKDRRTLQSIVDELAHILGLLEHRA